MKKNTLLIIVLFIVGCSQQVNNKDVITINIDELQIDSKTPYSEIFESVELVQLKRPNQSIIGKIHDIKLIGDTLFVFDMIFAKCLFLYTLNGEFINKVGAIGKGPGEYISPTSFFVDHANRAIYISDSQLQKVFKYSYDGSFLKEIKTGCRGRSVFVNADKDIFIDVATRNGEEYLFKSINEKTLKEDHYLKFPQDNKGWDINTILNRKKFFAFKNRILYYNYSSDTIYQILNKTVSPFISINSNNPLTANDIKGISKDVENFGLSLFELNEEGKYFGVYDFLMNDRMVYMNIDYQQRAINIVYSIKQNKIIGQNFFDDIAHIPSRNFFDIYEDKMIMAMPDSHFDFEEYKENLKSGKLTVPANFLKSILSLENVENNPVILLYKVKEDI